MVVAGDQRFRRCSRAPACGRSPYAPDLVLTGVAEGDPHAAWPLFVGKAARDGLPTAYACRGYACDEPTTDPSRLEAQVRALAPRP